MSHLRLAVVAALVLFALSCGGGGLDVCNFSPTSPASKDYRHDAKQVGLPAPNGTETSVGGIISWGEPTPPGFQAARQGREQQLFHISQAFVQSVWLQPTDGDIHMEISDTPDKNAPRVIVETPETSAYCPARQQELALITKQGIQLTTTRTEVAKPFPVSVLGLAFEDHPHSGRGSQFVATIWELHPAVVQ